MEKTNVIELEGRAGRADPLTELLYGAQLRERVDGHRLRWPMVYRQPVLTSLRELAVMRGDTFKLVIPA